MALLSSLFFWRNAVHFAIKPLVCRASGRPSRKMGGTRARRWSVDFAQKILGYCRVLGSLAVLAALAACAAGTGPQLSNQANTKAGAGQYQVVDVSKALVNVPTAMLVLERRSKGAREQRIILPNPTTLRGDNEIMVWTHSAGRTLKHFSFASVKAEFGGLPHPFGNLSSGGLESGSDALGNFVYAQKNYGTNTKCVLVLRRLSAGSRAMASGTSALDVLMRNCTAGTLEDALAPMGGNALGYQATSTGAIYSLSPLAAPGG